MKIVDYQATPSGYYQISFRNDEGQTVTATQHGRGGCNLYTPWQMKDELMDWLDTKRDMAIDYLTRTGFPDLAQAIRDKDNEWEDSVVLAICDLIDLRYLRVEG